MFPLHQSHGWDVLPCFLIPISTLKTQPQEIRFWIMFPWMAVVIICTAIREVEASNKNYWQVTRAKLVMMMIRKNWCIGILRGKGGKKWPPFVLLFELFSLSSTSRWTACIQLLIFIVHTYVEFTFQINGYPFFLF